MKVNPNWAETESGSEAAKNPTFTSASRECQDFYDKIRAAEPKITDTIKSLAQSHGYAMHGLEYSVKTTESIEDKMGRVIQESAEEGRPAPKDIDMLKGFKDILRYTIIVDHKDIAKAKKNILNDINKKYEMSGYELFKVSNKFENPEKDSGYKGMHLGAVTPNAIKMELQIHSEESQTAKDEGHAIYDIIRSPDSDLTDDKKDELLKECREIFGKVESPPGINEIDSFNENPDPIVARKEAEIEQESKESAAVSDLADTILENAKEIVETVLDEFQENKVNDFENNEQDKQESKVEEEKVSSDNEEEKIENESDEKVENNDIGEKVD